MAKRANIESKTENILIYGGAILGMSLFAIGGFIWAAIKRANDIAADKTKLFRLDNIYYYTFMVLMIVLLAGGLVLTILGLISKHKNK